MTKNSLTLVAVCATLLWAGAAAARPPFPTPPKGGLPQCESNLTSETGLYNSCETNLTTAQLCGNEVIDTGEECDGSNLDGKTCAEVDPSNPYGTLKCANCQFDTGGCTDERFVDNGGDTVTDRKTGLMWEQTTQTAGKINNWNNMYTWSTGGNLANGTAFTSFLATLNNGAAPYNGGSLSPITGCFANHCDWRLPSIVELKGIVDTSATGCGSGGACIDPIFGPTQHDYYWSATTHVGHLNEAWVVYFAFGTTSSGVKNTPIGTYVRAVRSAK